MDSPAERPVDNSPYPGSQPRLTVEAVLSRLRSVLELLGDVDFAYLFGSVAKGRARASSDIDVAIHFSCVFAAADDRLRLADHTLEVEGLLERELRRPVHVVALNTAPLRLRQNVLQHGLLAVVRDDDARRRFYVEHARRYHDLDHARRIFARYMSRRIENGTFGG